MNLGEFINLLKQHGGMEDEVIIEDETDWIYNIEGVYWDDIAKVVVIVANIVEEEQ